MLALRLPPELEKRLDALAKKTGRTKSFYARVMNPNLASLMPQAIAAWCEGLGHHVTYVCYTGFEDLEALEQVAEFIDQPRNNTFRATIKFWRNTFGQRCYLGDPHSAPVGALYRDSRAI